WAPPPPRMKAVLPISELPLTGTVNRVKTSSAPAPRAAAWKSTARPPPPLRPTGSASMPPKKPSGLITLTCQCSARTAAPDRPGAVIPAIFPDDASGNRPFGTTRRWLRAGQAATGPEQDQSGTRNDGGGWYQ